MMIPIDCYFLDGVKHVERCWNMLKPKPDIIHILYTIYILYMYRRKRACCPAHAPATKVTRRKRWTTLGTKNIWAVAAKPVLVDDCRVLHIYSYIYIIPIFFLGLHMISYHNPPWNHCQPGFLGMTECSARCSFSWILSCCGFCMFYVVNISKHMLSFGPWWIELDIRT